MIKKIIKGLEFFKRMHSNGTPINSFSLMSFHHPDSLTWRFAIHYSREKSGKTGIYFMRTHRGDQGLNFHAGINLPLFGSLTIQTQPHMWRADIEKRKQTRKNRNETI